MLNDEAKLTKLPRHLITLIISLLVLLVLFLLVMLWYDRKLNHIQSEEQKLRKEISANSF
jgi:hypothetical protein